MCISWTIGCLTFSLTSNSRNVLLVKWYREEFNRKEYRRHSMYPQTTWTVLVQLRTWDPQECVKLSAQVGDLTVGLEPLPNSHTNGIWVIKSDKPKRNGETLCSKNKARHRGQTTLLCILTAIFVVPKLRCRERSRQTVFTCFRGVESTALL